MKNPAAVALGKLGGAAKSDAKTKSSRENGKRGGRPRHHCNVYGWSHCCVCDGRIHLDGCASRMNPKIDCCDARHKQLFDAGQTEGVGDSSFLMWTPAHPRGIHRSEV